MVVISSGSPHKDCVPPKELNDTFILYKVKYRVLKSRLNFYICSVLCHCCLAARAVSTGRRAGFLLDWWVASSDWSNSVVNHNKPRAATRFSRIIVVNEKLVKL